MYGIILAIGPSSPQLGAEHLCCNLRGNEDATVAVAWTISGWSALQTNILCPHAVLNDTAHGLIENFTAFGQGMLLVVCRAFRGFDRQGTTVIAPPNGEIEVGCLYVQESRPTTPQLER